MTEAPAPHIAVDLTNCDREPIHIPGRIQPHGALLAFTAPKLSLTHVSDNTESLFGIPAATLLGTDGSALLGARGVLHLRNCLSSLDPTRMNPVKLMLSTPAGPASFDCIVHRTDQALILEMEPSVGGRSVEFLGFYHAVRDSLTRLQKTSGVDALCQFAAEEVRRITGFDRVMGYRFDEEWNGAVIAEAKRADMGSWLGLRYPASDIPSQARALYTRNWLRMAFDVGCTPAALLAALETGETPLDLSFSILRAVSPIHIQYLKNMGVGASMSVSIMRGDKLWGLIACHHETARFLPYETRAACEFLGQILSVQITAGEDVEEQGYIARLRDIRMRLQDGLRDWSTGAKFPHALESDLLELFGASGAAVCIGGKIDAIGQTPTAAEIQKIVEYLKTRPEEEVYATESIARDIPASEIPPETASGLLALFIDRSRGDCLLWFRPEVIRTVDWAGDPHKPVDPEGDSMVLHPRKSFEIWKQSVRDRSLPWRSADLTTAAEMRAALLGAALRRAFADVSRLNGELKSSNAELDAFAYIVSHDLKEPLRGIRNYAAILAEDQAEILVGEGREQLVTLSALTGRMEGLIDSLLEYSRVGRVEMEFEPIDLNKVAAETRQILHTQLEQPGMELRIPRPLPTLPVDHVRIGHVYQNLIGNALKYRDGAGGWIELGYTDDGSVWPPGEEGGDTPPIVLWVRDNGIGIPERRWDDVFQIFRRLHGRDKYGGGSGAGLTIVKRIVERHGGRIWIDSAVGSGTTFYFTLAQPRENGAAWTANEV
ncbi:MAG: multi-sensor signal transduction histidine kinase [Capsulimonas sp.]|nr:multi-sensor signal transduction histidine kinase [Capsulimonas sp.]